VDALRGLWETLKQLRHQPPTPKFCPKCRGHKIYPRSTMGILPMKYVCRDCGYEGSIVLEIDPEEDHQEPPN